MPSTDRRVFDHVLVIMFENQYCGYVLQNPYFRWLAKQGILLRSSFGVMHPSQTNYIASVAGELCNVADDSPPAPLLQRTIVDLLEEAPDGLTWKGYMQSFVPEAQRWSPNLVPEDQFPYMVRHNPFALFANIQRDKGRWERIQDESAFWVDVLNGSLPNFAWFTPNMWNDGHYLDGTRKESNPRAPGLVDQSAAWLASFFGALRFPGPLSHLPPRTLVVVTFDEADYTSDYKEEQGNANPYDGPNQVYTVLLGDMIEPGEEHEAYNHYSLLRTIEENFSLPSLGKNDASSNWYQFLWGRHFAWKRATEAPIRDASNIAMTELDGSLHIVRTNKTGALLTCAWDGTIFSPEREIGARAAGPIALVAHEGKLFLAYRDIERRLIVMTYDAVAGWSRAAAPVSEPIGSSLALAPFNDNKALMLAYTNLEGAIHTAVFQGGEWAEPTRVHGFRTDGAMTLCALGPSLYLVHKVVGSSEMAVVSYNTAPFNVVHPSSVVPGRNNATTINAWSPSEVPVAHYAFSPDRNTPGQVEPLLAPYRTGGPIAMAECDGVIHLVHPGATNPVLVRETFSLAGVMTPALPISYSSADRHKNNDGFGTLAQAGWSRPQPIHGASSEGDVAMARLGADLILAFQPKAEGPVHFYRGGSAASPVA